ncbi:hypothetical protein K788_00036900 (plasmid) [Paraburkholderia caribensis MBA4]|uniref:Uncharacterized protein n=1 Tax=Paraburkholderia caribensis MBA4 TaxID=1323664 RepID=A0A0P0RRW9_9BURK|nr:hypothetical protein K788_00036900 [Paraburkholderia caribensis MBA4]
MVNSCFFMGVFAFCIRIDIFAYIDDFVNAFDAFSSFPPEGI